MLLGGGAVTNHTAQLGAARGHKCKGPVPKICGTAQKQDIELHCNLTVPGAAFPVKGGCSPETRACGIRSSPGAFHGNHMEKSRETS